MKFAHFIKEDNFTTMYKKLQGDLLDQGTFTKPRDMGTYELLNVNLVLTNPRERLLYSRVRKHNYTYGAAEFLWYMSGTNQLDFIEYYLQKMRDFSDDGETLNSAYGYRIFGNHAEFPHQWRNVEYKLLADPDTRQGVITIHYQKDIATETKDVPCAMNLHFIIRDNKLNLLVQMRSNDAFMGLIYDVFSFTLLQEHMFNFLKPQAGFEKLELGTYVHRSDSMHLYRRNKDRVLTLLSEGNVSDLELPPEQLIFDSDQLHDLLIDESLLRSSRIDIKPDDYTGICKYMAEKLNKILITT